jgi:hypothetical protein
MEKYWRAKNDWIEEDHFGQESDPSEQHCELD